MRGFIGIPALAAQAHEVIDRLSPEGVHLVTAIFDDTTRGRWTMTHAHGFDTDVWRRPLSSGA